MLASQIFKGGVDLAAIIRSGVRRRFHSGEQHGRPFCFCVLDYFSKVLFHRGNWLPSKNVVCAKLEDHDFDFSFQRPIDPPKSSRRCIP